MKKACLRWESQRKTLSEIALLEGKSLIDIELCLERALVSLDAKSLEEAIEKAELQKRVE
ncbi:MULTISPECIES: hypothetical protein [Rhizobium/Agrobacterium group]|uniref:hypothetical protein n=1 Tax=Rhizobium/Agrobacterium group TaxID=227290 RepID=UPI0004D556A5|nr:MULTISPECIES: hypothetical protein [Rhizobium/Agrobacterium group]KEA04406.1 hypothetical protein CN09_18860 [Rhizobium rhizogenes]NMV72521.1 hypothetical protein [Agrobacterium fabrum]NTI85414.1 hypothetical protein [Rhizobium rhizogenes]NTJ27597.1 hypothetical protein [Rhizobium rhizogenes]QRM41784.1 hypothetical protein F3X89_28510 [Rhizobium rhizogenes]